MSETVYRFYDEEKKLLYVGVTSNPGRRMENHAAEKPWWEEVRVVLVEHFPTRDAALQAEREAIWQEKPLHNVAHTLRDEPSGHVSPKVARALSDPRAVPGAVRIARAAGYEVPRESWPMCCRCSKPCSGVNRDRLIRGLCPACYQRWKRQRPVVAVSAEPPGRIDIDA